LLQSTRKFTFILSIIALVTNAHVHAKATANTNLKRYSSIISSPYTTWGLRHDNDKSINIIPAWKLLKVKKTITVGVVDTGIDPHHPLVSKNIAHPKTSQGVRRPTSSSFGVDFSKGSDDKFAPFDQNGHGTHIAGIIKSVFPDVKMLALKYYNPKASGYENLVSTLAALKYAVDANVDVINYSGGGPEPSIDEFRILKEAERKGILVVAAAGNNRSNIDVKKNAYYPASYNLSNILTVTAYDPNMNILQSSNYGAKKVHIAAPGHKIASALPMGRYGYLTGTSQATAFVSGVAAMIKSMYPEMTPQEVKKIILGSAKMERQFKGKCITAGRLDAGAALKAVILERGSEAEQNSTIAKKKRLRQLASKKNKKSKKARIIMIKGKKKIVRKRKSKRFRDTLFKSSSTTKKVKPGKIIYRL
jgi:subtilisin family serine protease